MPTELMTDKLRRAYRAPLLGEEQVQSYGTRAISMEAPSVEKHFERLATATRGFKNLGRAVAKLPAQTANLIMDVGGYVATGRWLTDIGENIDFLWKNKDLFAQAYRKASQGAATPEESDFVNLYSARMTQAVADAMAGGAPGGAVGPSAVGMTRREAKSALFKAWHKEARPRIIREGLEPRSTAEILGPAMRAIEKAPEGTFKGVDRFLFSREPHRAFYTPETKLVGFRRTTIPSPYSLYHEAVHGLQNVLRGKAKKLSVKEQAIFAQSEKLHKPMLDVFWETEHKFPLHKIDPAELQAIELAKILESGTLKSKEGLQKEFTRTYLGSLRKGKQLFREWAFKNPREARQYFKGTLLREGGAKLPAVGTRLPFLEKHAIRYEGVQEGFGKTPSTFQITPQAGPLKGRTMNVKSLDEETIMQKLAEAYKKGVTIR
jgi:hypothetical protein